MPKRKRDDGTEGTPEKSPEPVADPKQKRLQLKLHQATVKLGHAFKVAKGFERQKLGRRQKTAAAAKNEKDAQRVETEIAALKALDTTVAAQHHLYKCLLKIKAVQTSPRLVPELSKLKPVQRDAATLNILSRLASSKPAKDALNTVIEDVQSAAGVVRKTQKKEGSPPAKEKKAAPPVLNPLEITDEEDAADGDSEEGDSDDDFGGFDDRLGSDDSDNDSDVSMDDRPPPSKPKASAFIPSLSVGYVAGSGSEPESDIEELTAVKKNRRGQRARQQLAEKKFGAKAKHLLNPKNDRSQGWDAKRGATDGARGGRGGGRGGFGAGRGGFGAGAGRGGSFSKGAPPAGGDARPPPKKKHNDDEGPLHPSWAAAKAAKDKKAVPVVFTGKKISFD